MVLISNRSFITQPGFTLVEMMIVIVIIGILATIALPVYQNNAIRARTAEALLAGSVVKNVVIENISDNGGTIPDDACIGFIDISTATNNVAIVRCNATTGAITMLTTDKAGATTFTLTPTPTSNSVSWVCSADIAKYAPVECH